MHVLTLIPKLSCPTTNSKECKQKCSLLTHIFACLEACCVRLKVKKQQIIKPLHAFTNPPFNINKIYF